MDLNSLLLEFLYNFEVYCTFLQNWKLCFWCHLWIKWLSKKILFWFLDVKFPSFVEFIHSTYLFNISWNFVKDVVGWRFSTSALMTLFKKKSFKIIHQTQQSYFFLKFDLNLLHNLNNDEILLLFWVLKYTQLLPKAGKFEPVRRRRCTARCIKEKDN